MLTQACDCGVRTALGFMRCPRCHALTPQFAGLAKEDAMPRITVAGGASNPHALPGEVGYIEPAVTAPADAASEAVVEGFLSPDAAALLPEGWNADPVPPAVPQTPDYGSMTQAALREEAKARGLPVGGSKADLAARLTDHDATADA